MTKHTQLTRRRFLTATGGAAAAVALAGCSGEPDGGNEDDGNGGDQGKRKVDNTVDNPNADATLNEINSTITTFDPIAATDTASGRVIQQMFDCLINYPDGRNEVTEQLAQGYELSDDQMTYTFTLKDAKFHNGKTVTAGDFVYSFERLAASENSRRSNFILSKLGVQHQTETVTQDGEETEVYVSKSMAVRAVDEKTLEITLEAPFHAAVELLAYTSFAAVPQGIVGDIEGVDGEMEYDQFASQGPVGAGPFKFEMWGGGEAEISRFEDYHDGAASIAGVHWQVIEKDDPAHTYVINKNADVFGIPTSKYDPNKVLVDDSTQTDFGGTFGHYDKLENDEVVNHYRITPLSVFYLGFNMANVPKPVRQAFAYATNQQQMVKDLFKGRGRAAAHITPPNIFPGGKSGYEDHAQDYPYNETKGEIEQAKQVMEDAGYGEDNRYSLTLTRYQSETWKQIVQRLRDKMKSVYIDVELNPTDFSTLTQQGRQGKLEVYTLGWIADWPAADTFLQLINPPQTDTSLAGPVSYLNWKPENGSEAQTATDAWNTVNQNKQPGEEAKTKREEAYLTMEEANWEDVGFIPIFHRRSEVFWYDWVEYPAFGPMGRSRQMLNNVKIGERS